jgi:hypothetical protein
MTPDSLPATSGPSAVDPLAVPCSRCDAEPGQRCMMLSDWARKPHAVRRGLALALASHADPALDAFPELGPVSPCGICGTPGLPQRHRVVDAIADQVAAGEDEEDLAGEFGVPLAAVFAVAEWARRWFPEKGRQR